MSIVACYCNKGGVGKTSAAVNLACASGERGHRTLLVDLDQQGSAGFYFRVRPPDTHRAKALLKRTPHALHAIRETDYPGLHILPSDFSYRNIDALLYRRAGSKGALAELLTGLDDTYRVVWIDCSPSIGAVAETVFGIADVILVPVIPTTLSERTYEQLRSFLGSGDSRARERLRPFFSMVDRRKRMHLDTMERMRAHTPHMMKTEIPFCAEIEAMGLRREPVLCFAPRHRSSAAFRALWRELWGELRG